MRLTSYIPALDMLTSPLVLLSKPVGPIMISHFFIKELFLGRYPNIASQHFGRAIGRTWYLPLSLTRSAKVTHIHQTIKSLLTLPITLILVNNYTKIPYEVRNHQGT